MFDRKCDIVKSRCLFKKRSDFTIAPSGNAAADTRYKECQFRVRFCISRKIVNVLADNINASVHCRNRIALTGHTDTDAPFCAELFMGDACCSTTVPALFITALCQRLHTLPNTKISPSLREVIYCGVILSCFVMLFSIYYFPYSYV